MNRPGFGESAFLEVTMNRHYRRWWWQFWKPKRPPMMQWVSQSYHPEDCSGYIVPMDNDPRR